ncbi:glutamine-hydrolyzing carbamoyl-phosphate synthase small subunit [Candidatus Fermentibacteria bacterium]|nr:glutamine-hydrolyzing carbamoyl-phosphate synthase small subunit [Candidatus Fermentibacteria bacterium]
MRTTGSESGTRGGALVLEDGFRAEGLLFGSQEAAGGEVVFNTGMVGYPEALTDPSYHGQILVMTYPMIGNYGVPDLTHDQYGLPVGFESEKIQVTGLVVCEHSDFPSHFSSTRTLDQWLSEQNVSGLWGVDTRALTRRLRASGTAPGGIVLSEGKLPNGSDQAEMYSVSITEPMLSSHHGDAAPQVVLVDCGCKASIHRSLLAKGMNVVRVPHDHPFSEMEYDGLVLSNGPGDPTEWQETVLQTEMALKRDEPVLGICLGHQLIALAAGATTYKMKYGHRSQNQPCLESRGDPARCLLTSQNHGYAVEEASLPEDWEVWFSNVNDMTVEGIRHRSRPLEGVQFHPEASPGPLDAKWIFDGFAASVSELTAKRKGGARS